MKCSFCDAELPENAVFCGNCGSRVPQPEPVIVPPVTEPVAPEAPVIEAPVIEAPVIEAPVIETPVFEFPYSTPPVVEPPAQPVQERVKVKSPKKEKPPKQEKKKWKPGPVARVFLRLASCLLCICLFASLLTTALLVDLRMLTSADAMETSIQSALSASAGSAQTSTIRNTLVNMVYDTIKSQDSQQKVTATADQIGDFLTRSTANEFLSEKAAGLLTDFINGTEDTKIRTDDVIQLIEDNEPLIEEIFGIQADKKMKQDVRKFMEDNNVEDMVHDEVFAAIRSAKIPGGSVEDLLTSLRKLSAPLPLIIVILINLALIGLLFVTNWLRVGATMKCVGSSMTCAGVLLSIPVLLIQLIPGAVIKLGGAVTGIISLLVSIIAPVHYILLCAGVVLIIAGFVVKLIEKLARK